MSPTGGPFAVRAAANDPAALDRARAEFPELLRQAAGRSHWETVRVLAELGFEVGIGSPTALHYAAAAGDRSAVDFLLEHGADRTAVDARFQRTPHGWATYFGHGDLADHLEPDA